MGLVLSTAAWLPIIHRFLPKHSNLNLVGTPNFSFIAVDACKLCKDEDSEEDTNKDEPCVADNMLDYLIPEPVFGVVKKI